jgi:serine/threonine-protein kinase SRPK3
MSCQSGGSKSCGPWTALGTGDKTEKNLQEWLEETYFDGVREETLSRADIVKVGALIHRLLRFEPSTRASAQEILQDPWFRDK